MVKKWRERELDTCHSTETGEGSGRGRCWVTEDTGRRSKAARGGGDKKQRTVSWAHPHTPRGATTCVSAQRRGKVARYQRDNTADVIGMATVYSRRYPPGVCSQLLLLETKGCLQKQQNRDASRWDYLCGLSYTANGGNSARAMHQHQRQSQQAVHHSQPSTSHGDSSMYNSVREILVKTHFTKFTGKRAVNLKSETTW